MQRGDLCQSLCQPLCVSGLCSLLVSVCVSSSPVFIPHSLRLQCLLLGCIISAAAVASELSVDGLERWLSG